MLLDLYNRQYNLSTLKNHIYAFNLIDILKTQKLTCDFCIKYILNTNYQITEEEEKITIADVIKYQPHISKYELFVGLMNYDVEYDSFEDFESVSNKGEKEKEKEKEKVVVSQPNTYYNKETK
jgi:hypothetical protein